MSDNDNKVEFRLSPAFLEQLEENLVKYNQTHGLKAGLKRSEFAKKLFTEALQRESVNEEVQMMNDQLRKLRKEIATTLAAMLIEFRNMDAKKAHDWIQQRFLKE